MACLVVPQTVAAPRTPDANRGMRRLYSQDDVWRYRASRHQSLACRLRESHRSAFECDLRLSWSRSPVAILGRSVPFLDLLQEGNIGCRRASRDITGGAVSVSARTSTGGFVRPSRD